MTFLVDEHEPFLHARIAHRVGDGRRDIDERHLAGDGER
jgi:hypothetical protein